MVDQNNDHLLPTREDILRFLNEADEQADDYEQDVGIVRTGQGVDILMRRRIGRGPGDHRTAQIGHVDRLVNDGHIMRGANSVRISPEGKRLFKGPYAGRA